MTGGAAGGADGRGSDEDRPRETRVDAASKLQPISDGLIDADQFTETAATGTTPARTPRPNQALSVDTKDGPPSESKSARRPVRLANGRGKDGSQNFAFPYVEPATNRQRTIQLTADIPATPSDESTLVVAPSGESRDGTLRAMLTPIDASQSGEDSRNDSLDTLMDLTRPEAVPGVDMQATRDDLVSLSATGADLIGVLRMIADHHGLNLVIAPEVVGTVTVHVKDAELDEILDAITHVSGLHWHQERNLLYVTAQQTQSSMPASQGRYVRVYDLNYISATDIESLATSLLSPMGSSHVMESSSTDQRRTAERLVVDDVVAVHQAIEQTLAQLDVLPQQVLVEVHLLKALLSDEDRCGINLNGIARASGTRVRLTGSGFGQLADSVSQFAPLTGVGIGATPRLPFEYAAGSQSSVALQIEGSDMQGLIEAIQQTTNARTLASPKVSVVNRQEARIQIGQRLPYVVSTTTNTVTVESVEFLEVGIVLTVEPIITEDGNIVMTVSPKVSDGTRVGEYYQEDTTELNTTILLPNGGGVVIGGLINEKDQDESARVPGLGNLPLVGKLFQRNSRETRREELIVALVAHIVPNCGCPPRHRESEELIKTLPPYASGSLTAESGTEFPILPVDAAGLVAP